MIQIVFHCAHSHTDRVQLSQVTTDCIPQRFSNNLIIFCSVGVDGSKPNIVFIDDGDDKFNFEHDGNLYPSNSQLRREYHDSHNPNPPYYIPERYLEMRNRNAGRDWYPGIRRPDIGQYYWYY